MTGYIYTLHFDKAITHTRHYTGCTTELRQRLASHAQGRGARLLRVLKEREIGWELGGLSSCTVSEMRRLERLLKRQHNAKRYCQLCQGTEAARLGEAQPLDLEVIPWPRRCEELRVYGLRSWSPRIRFAKEQEPDWVRGGIEELVRANKDGIGFIPVGGAGGLSWAASRGKLLLGTVGQELAGFLLFSQGRAGCRIQQVVVADRHRRCGIGKQLVDYLGRSRPKEVLSCWVREDLIANEFWTGIGFEVIDLKKHKSSGSTLLQYERLPGSRTGHKLPSKPAK